MTEPLPVGASLLLSPAVSTTAQAQTRYAYGVADGPKPSTPGAGPGPAVVFLPSATNGIIWPLVGPLTQPFGVPELGVGGPHTGIDIGQSVGTPVRAAQAGRVVFSGGDPCCNLGFWVEINHGNRYSTRYGHFMRPPIVLPGDYVQQGQIVGFSGDTGFSTGPHLHFEVRLDGTPVDPLRLLPLR